jgi:integrase
MRIPAELQALVGKKEFHQSLRTTDPAEGKRRVGIERLHAQSLLAKARRSLAAESQMTELVAAEKLDESELWNLMAEWFVKGVRADEGVILNEAAQDNLVMELPDLIDFDDHNTASYVYAQTIQLLKQHHLSLDRDSASFMRLQEMLHSAIVERKRRLVARFASKVDFVLNPDLAGLTSRSPPRPREENTTLSGAPIAQAALGIAADRPHLLDIVPIWAAERRAAPKTVDAHEAAARWLEQRAGRVPLDRLTRKHILTFKDKMLAEGVTPANANVKLNRLKTLLNFAETNDLIPTNPAKGIGLLDPDANRNRRRPFDRTSLAAIFGSPVYGQDSRPREGRGEAAYWLPMLALFTGARLEELGQMRASDVVHEPYQDAEDAEHHAWALRITEDEADGLKLKNSGSERLVPVHPDLVALGFVKFAQAAQAAGQERLFPELKPDKYGRRTAKWGEWFSRYKRDVCGVIDRRQVFHSFRHTFKDQARDARIPEGIQRKIMGHAAKDEADNYGDGHGFHRLVEGMATYRVAGLKLPPPPPQFR